MEEGGPVCARCKATSSLMWHKGDDGAVLCLECHNSAENSSGSSSKANSETSSLNGHHNGTINGQVNGGGGAAAAPSGHGRKTRLRERSSKAKQARLGEKQQRGGGNGSHGSASSRSQQQQKSRRTLAKTKPMRAPKAQPSIVTSNSITYKGTLFEVGDIVSVLDRDGGVYYAILRGFLMDQYAEKYAVLTWLLPTRPNPTHFDPLTFIMGPEEDNPRAMQHLEFVCHSPQSRHFQASYFHDIEQAEQWKGATSFGGPGHYFVPGRGGTGSP